MQFSRSAPRTVLTCTFPSLRSSQIAVPKRPSPALARAGFVNFAFSRHIIEENAVAITEFFQAPANSDLARVLIIEFFNRQFNEVGDRLDFCFVNPNVTRRTGAAITATGTSESQSVIIPGLVGSFLGHRCLEVIIVTRSSCCLAQRHRNNMSSRLSTGNGKILVASANGQPMIVVSIEPKENYICCLGQNVTYLNFKIKLLCKLRCWIRE